MTAIENSLPSHQELKDLKMTPLDFEKVIIMETSLEAFFDELYACIKPWAIAFAFFKN